MVIHVERRLRARFGRGRAARLGCDYDREQLAAIQKALGEQNYEVMHDMCSEMFNRAKTRLAREHFEHYLQMCEEMMAVTRT